MAIFPPIISAKVLGALPQFALAELGEKGLIRALEESYLPYEFLDHREGYITGNTVATFVAQIGRQLGQDKVGLLFNPYLTVRDYGVWGAYVLAAPTMGQALNRSVAVMPLHASHDQARITSDSQFARFSYRSSLRSHTGYPDVAYSTIAVLASIPEHYIGPNWKPASIEFDFAKPDKAWEVEQTFGCPVTYNAQALAICFPKPDISAPNPTLADPGLVTPQDIARERSGGIPTSFTEVAGEAVRLQLREKTPSLERAAMIMDTSIRTLQRRLRQDGLTFRGLVNRIRIARSAELLHLKDETITSISHAMGYSNSKNFCRAFKLQTGLSPRAYRKTIA